MNKVHIIVGNASNWSALYVNEQLVVEAHKIDMRELTKVCPISEVKVDNVTESLESYLREYYVYPKMYKVVKLLLSLE